MTHLQDASIFFSVLVISFLIEVLWVASVKAVERRQVSTVVVIAAVFPFISYLATLIIVDVRWTIIPASLGHAMGAFREMRRIVSVESQTGDPTTEARSQSSSPS